MAEAAVKTKKTNKAKEYFKGVKSELRKVTWPTRKETYKYTLVVFVICLLFAIFFYVVDTLCILVLENALNIIM